MRCGNSQKMENEEWIISPLLCLYLSHSHHCCYPSFSNPNSKNPTITKAITITKLHQQISVPQLFFFSSPLSSSPFPFFSLLLLYALLSFLLRVFFLSILCYEDLSVSNFLQGKSSLSVCLCDFCGCPKALTLGVGFFLISFRWLMNRECMILYVEYPHICLSRLVAFIALLLLWTKLALIISYYFVEFPNLHRSRFLQGYSPLQFHPNFDWLDDLCMQCGSGCLLNYIFLGSLMWA